MFKATITPTMDTVSEVLPAGQTPGSVIFSLSWASGSRNKIATDAEVAAGIVFDNLPASTTFTLSAQRNFSGTNTPMKPAVTTTFNTPAPPPAPTTYTVVGSLPVAVSLM